MTAVYTNTVINKTTPSHVDFFIYGEIGIDWWEGVDNSANSVVRQLNQLEAKHSTITIHINTLGGNLYDGIPIANKIKSSDKITTCNDGWAASMGGPILFAGKRAQAFRSSLIMIHSPWGYVVGSKTDFLSAAEEFEKHEHSLMVTIQERTKLTLEEISNRWFDGKDHWLTSEEALALGLIDEIVDGEGAAMPDVSNMAYKQVLAQYRDNTTIFNMPKVDGQGGTPPNDQEKQTFLNKIFGLKNKQNSTPANQAKPKTTEDENKPKNTQTMRRISNEKLTYAGILAIIGNLEIDDEAGIVQIPISDTVKINDKLTNLTDQNTSLTSANKDLTDKASATEIELTALKAQVKAQAEKLAKTPAASDFKADGDDKENKKENSWEGIADPEADHNKAAKEMGL